MQLPDAVKNLRARYVAAFPLPQGEPGEAIEESVRQWSIHLAEQVAFELPNQGWGTKRADPGRPISKDGLARQVDGRLLIWDMVTGAGTGHGSIVPDPQSDDITGQFFVAVRPTNHLGAPTPVPVDVPPTPQPSPQPVDLGPVLAAIQTLFAQNEAIKGELSAQSTAVAEQSESIAKLLERPTPPHPALVGSLFGYRVRLTPESSPVT